MKLTEHFYLEEFTDSQTADRQGIDNTPPPAAIEAMQALCTHVLEPLRASLGPVSISSGYRCLALNRAIRSGDNSQHVRGEAADISVKGHTLAEVFNWLQAHAPFDQLIREFPPRGWVHVSHTRLYQRQRGMSLLATLKPDGSTAYPSQFGPVSV